MQYDLVGSPSFRLVIYLGMSQIFLQAKRMRYKVQCVPKVDLLRTKFQWHFLRNLKPVKKCFLCVSLSSSPHFNSMALDSEMS